MEKYWAQLDVPNKAYPTTYPVGDGRFVHLSYLAPLLCFADELDVAANRNISFLYDIDKIENPIRQLEHCKYQAILSVDIDRQTITLYAQSDDAVIRNELMLIREKIEEKLHYCRMVAENRSACEAAFRAQ